MEPEEIVCPGPCRLCGGDATRWSGGDMHNSTGRENIGVVFMCKSCDSDHNWFDYDGEAMFQDAAGKWHVLPEDA